MTATIFVVDGDPTFLELARRSLAPLGRVQAFQCAAEAIAHSPDVVPSLVVANLVLDDLGGFELMRRLADPETRFVFVSRLDDDETVA